MSFESSYSCFLFFYRCYIKISLMEQNEIKVDIEYCGTCGYAAKYAEVAAHIGQKFPDVGITGHEGRRATFEVKINDVLVHSKLRTMAWPDLDDVSDIIKDAKSGKEIRPAKSQPITDCTLL